MLSILCNTSSFACIATLPINRLDRLFTISLSVSFPVLFYLIVLLLLIIPDTVEHGAFQFARVTQCATANIEPGFWVYLGVEVMLEPENGPLMGGGDVWFGADHHDADEEAVPDVVVEAVEEEDVGLHVGEGVDLLAPLVEELFADLPPLVLPDEILFDLPLLDPPPVDLPLILPETPEQSSEDDDDV